MKSHIAAAATAVFMMVGVSQAMAQDVLIAPEQEVIVREYVRTRPVTSITIPDTRLEVGTAIPQEVELYSIEEPDIQYRYVVVDDRTVLVDPETRQIIRVLD